MTDQLTAEFSLESVGGRSLRVARWRWDMASDHLPILFFNGIGTNIEAVAHLAEALTDRPFIMFDMPGVGGSTAPLVPYNPFTISWTARQLLRRFACDAVDVMGLSWGGAIAQHFALQHSRCVRRLVLCATSAGMAMVPGNPAALAGLDDLARYADPTYLSRHFTKLYRGLSGDDAGNGDRLTMPTARGFAYQLLAMCGWTSAPALPLLSHKTLIMMGEDDQVVPVSNGSILEALIPHSQLEIFAGGGHLFLHTHREQTLASLRGFLDAPDRAPAPHQPDRKAA